MMRWQVIRDHSLDRQKLEFPARLNRLPLQGRGNPSSGALAILRGHRVRHADLGRLVQSSPAAGAYRQHPAGRSRRTLLLHAR